MNREEMICKLDLCHAESNNDEDKAWWALREALSYPIELYTAIGNVQQEVGSILKSADNPYFNSKYADLPSIWEKIKDKLRAEGLVISQPPVEINGCFGLETTIVHIKSGQYIKSAVSAKIDTSNPQKMGSAITYLRRYALCAILGLQVDEDDDGNASSGQKAKKDSGASQGPKIPVKDVNADLFISADQKKQLQSTLKAKQITAVMCNSWLKDMHFENPVTKGDVTKLSELSAADYDEMMEYAAHHPDKIRGMMDKDGKPIFVKG